MKICPLEISRGLFLTIKRTVQMFNNSKFLLFLLLGISLIGCKSSQQWEGQGPIQIVPTESKPIYIQAKKTFDVGSGIYLSNEFEGARLNDAILVNDTLIQVFISPENEPINPSPWYAFKIWSGEEKAIRLKFTYSENGFHRYYPKISKDGQTFSNFDSSSYFPDTIELQNGATRAQSAEVRLNISPDTLWIAGQDLVGTKHVDVWKQELLRHSFVSKTKIGKSTQGRDLEVLKIGESDDSRMVMAISMQHPPEIPGFLALKGFVETICGDTRLARKFREKYNTYVMPMMNPDGVANGHWRHNAGGIDTNRDWVNLNQPETKALTDFMKRKEAESGGEFFFAADFHATWEDIFYTMNEELEGNSPGLVPKIIKASSRKIKGYHPNIRPGEGNQRGVTSSSYFFFEHGAESMTFEVGDNTPRELIRKKGELTAKFLMKFLLKNKSA
ncbi:M14 family metallopeptidase [Algoriphagus sp. CAU 1675]|uniref:M14 family metallopeptidase n=1 Tax=Algoriphagus sp. CAU 1675 TaxID=3032597 RepID=UPI0023DADEE8|nr:M14 family metallopeptidase [Algoriphagus sp. CAU 1675]MDF2158267.1 M14 family metallopeptidase [Algoriphagus sp. CAU 1675]